MVLGRAASEKIAQLLDHHGQAGRLSSHYGVWGLWQDDRLLFSTGSKSRKARNLAQNANCVLCTEHANEAVIVEGVAEIADVAARRKFLAKYQAKYDFDMGSMKDDILSLKEPVFAVRPRVVFALGDTSRASPPLEVRITCGAGALPAKAMHDLSRS